MYNIFSTRSGTGNVSLSNLITSTHLLASWKMMRANFHGTVDKLQDKT